MEGGREGTAHVVAGRLQGLEIRASCEGPVIERCAADFLAPLVGRESWPPSEGVANVLEFALGRLDEGRGPQIPPGSPAVIQFVNIACRHAGGWLIASTRDGSSVRADVRAGRAWGYLSDELLETKRYLFADLLLAPLMEMLKRRTYYGLHAACVVKDGAGYLFPGGAGSGKTTTAIALVRQGFRYLADDKLLLTNDRGGIAALAFTRRFNIDPDLGGIYPELSGLSELAPLPFTTKRPLDISEIYANAFVSACAPRFIIHLEATTSLPSRIRPLSATESFHRLIRQTILASDSETASRQLTFFRDLARDTESYLLLNGRDLYGTPARLRELLPAP